MAQRLQEVSEQCVSHHLYYPRNKQRREQPSQDVPHQRTVRSRVEQNFHQSSYRDTPCSYQKREQHFASQNQYDKQDQAIPRSRLENQIQYQRCVSNNERGHLLEPHIRESY